MIKQQRYPKWMPRCIIVFAHAFAHACSVYVYIINYESSVIWYGDYSSYGVVVNYGIVVSI